MVHIIGVDVVFEILNYLLSPFFIKFCYMFFLVVVFLGTNCSIESALLFCYYLTLIPDLDM